MSASNYCFCFLTNEEEDDCKVVLISPKDDKTFDGHVSDDITPFWPTGIVMDEVCEGTFEIGERLSEEDVKAAFTAAGFVFDQDWQDEVSAGM